MKDIALEIYIALGLIGGTALLALIGLGVAAGVRRIPWERGQKIVMAAWGVLETVTQEANAELRARLVLARDPDSDGGKEVTRAEWDGAVDAALAKFKKLWAFSTLEELASAFGVKIDFLDEWLRSKITAGLSAPVSTDPPQA